MPETIENLIAEDAHKLNRALVRKVAINFAVGVGVTVASTLILNIIEAKLSSSSSTI